MTRTEAENKTEWTGTELLNLPAIVDLNGKKIENGQTVIIHREPWKNKKAIVKIDLVSDRNPYWFIYELIDEPKQKINHKVLWEGKEDWTQKVTIQ